MFNRLRSAVSAVRNRGYKDQPDYLAARELEKFILANASQDRERVAQLMRQNPDARCFGSKEYYFQHPEVQQLRDGSGWNVGLSLNPSLIPVSKEFHPDAEVDNVLVRDIAVDVRQAIMELARQHGVDFEVDFLTISSSATFKNVLPPHVTEYADRGPDICEMPGVELIKGEGFVKAPETMLGRGYVGSVGVTFKQPK
jgi:hypothetical protein